MTRGTIVLTPFPFTDLTGAKVRPAVIVSRSDRPGDDVILAFISSIPPQRPMEADFVIEPSHRDFTATGLKIASVIKCDKLATVERRILFGEIGRLSSSMIRELNQRLRYALEL